MSGAVGSANDSDDGVTHGVNTSASNELLGYFRSKYKKPSYCWEGQPFVAIFRT